MIFNSLLLIEPIIEIFLSFLANKFLIDELNIKDFKYLIKIKKPVPNI